MLERLRSRNGESKATRLEELDTDLRARLIQLVDTKFEEAFREDKVFNAVLFGQPVIAIDILDEAAKQLRVHQPHLDAQVAGYVPKIWVEFMQDPRIAGCFMEVREDEERLIDARSTKGGQVPEGLPVTNTRVMVASAVNSLEHGTILPQPSHRAA